MIVHGINDLIINTDRFCVGEPTPLKVEDYQEIKDQLNGTTNAQDALYAGLRTLSRYACDVASNRDMVASDLNDLSWIMKHLVDELEATGTLKSNLSFRLDMAYQHSQGISVY